MKHQIDIPAQSGQEALPRKRGRMSFQRMLRFQVLRILRIRATPHSIGLGVAAGVLAAFTPLIGVHVAISIGVAWLIGGNMIAAVTGTLLIGNPFTYPFIWAAMWEMGQLMLGRELRSGVHIHLHEIFAKGHLGTLWDPILKPMLIGFIPLSIVCGTVSYIIVFQAVRIFRARRQARLAAR